MLLPDVVGWLQSTNAQSLDSRLSESEPFNGGTIQVRVCNIGIILLNLSISEYIYPLYQSAIYS